LLLFGDFNQEFLAVPAECTLGQRRKKTPILFRPISPLRIRPRRSRCRPFPRLGLDVLVQAEITG